MNFEFNDSNNTWKPENAPKVDSFTHRWWNPKYRCTVITLVILVVIIGIFLFAFLTFGSSVDALNQSDARTLKLVSILFRHGARSPTGTYNSDPYKNYSWPDGWGQLTNLGKLQMFGLGETLRKRYSNFLPSDYSENDIYVKSSDKSRTLMSAYALLAGLYPPTAKQTWNSKIMWQPIPVHSIPRENDAILASKKSCPYYDKHYAEVKNSTAVKQINDKYQDIYELLTEHCNETVNTLVRVEFIYSHMEIERDNGLVLPKWSVGIFPEKMKDVPGVSLAEWTFDETMKRLRGGPLLKEIMEYMNSTLNGTSQLKMVLYSGHDLTIVNLWRTLTFEENLLPQFGAALVMELHEIPDKNDTEIKMLYYNSSYTTEPHVLLLPKCSDPCTLTEFKTLTDKHIPKDWDKECAIKET